MTPNPRGQQVGLIPVGWTDAAAERPALRRPGHAAARRAVELRPPRRAARRGGGPRADPDGEVQVARFGPSAWGVQLHPEVDETIVGTWVTDSERGELADRGLDADALLGEIKEAREELDHAWAPLAAGFADVALGPDGRARRADPTTDKGTLARMGFQDPERPRPDLRPARGGVAEPLRRADRPDRGPRPGAQPPGPPGRRPGRPRADAPGARRRRGHRDAAALGARRQRGAGRPPVPPPRALARAHRPDDGLDPPRGVRRARGPAARGRRRPARRRARPRPSPTTRPWTRCGSSTAGSCSAWPPAT